MNKATIIEVIANQLGIDPCEIDDDTDIMDDLGADSLDVVEILMSFEEDHGVTVPDEDVIKFRKIRDIIEYFEKNI